MDFELITCPEWGARPPKQDPVLVGKSRRVIIHHTAGHHPEVSNRASESRAESIAYARAIQNYHMDANGWNDSGHNFLVCRNAIVLQGRWMTVAAIQHDQMVVSAHCLGQNDQIGIEHEHAGQEPMSATQREASARLVAWISRLYRRSTAMPLAPHNRYVATSCPANLTQDIPWLRARAQRLMDVT